MRRALMVLSLVCVTVPAFAWGARKKVERHCLNILIRRLEIIVEETGDPEIEESARKCLYLLDALTAMRGTVDEEDEITLDSPSEQRIIFQVMGLAALAEARRGFWSEVWDATERKIWKWVKSRVLTSVPWLVIAVFLYYRYRLMTRVARAYDRDVDKLEGGVRKETFTNPLVKKQHERFRKQAI